MLKKRTYCPKPGEIDSKWYLVDAEGQVLGRLASRIALVLRGKHKPQFTPHVDTGDHVVVVNADKVVLTGRKPLQKQYHRHSGYPGGIRSTGYERMLREKPERTLELAVKRMLPRNHLGRQLLKKLKVYAGSEHPHEAQSPEKTDFAFLNR